MIERFRAEKVELEKLWQEGAVGIDPLRQFSGLVDRFLVDHFEGVVAQDKGTSVRLWPWGAMVGRNFFPARMSI